MAQATPTQPLVAQSLAAQPLQSAQQQSPPAQMSAPQETGGGRGFSWPPFLGRYQRFIWLAFVVIAALVVAKMVFFKSAVISVVGTGQVTATPDKVEMLVTKVDSNPDPVLAINAGESSISQIIAKAQEIAGEEVAVQKSFYQVTPSVVTGDVLYQVVNVFKITANDPSLASNLIKGFYSSGATTVSGVNFVPKDKERVTREARKAAIKDARQQAKSIARAAGKRVWRIINIGDDLSQGNSTISSEASQVGAGQNGEGGGSQVNYTGGAPSEIDVAKSMTVTYEIW